MVRETLPMPDQSGLCMERSPGQSTEIGEAMVVTRIEGGWVIRDGETLIELKGSAKRGSMRIVADRSVPIRRSELPKAG